MVWYGLLDITEKYIVIAKYLIKYITAFDLCFFLCSFFINVINCVFTST